MHQGEHLHVVVQIGFAATMCWTDLHIRFPIGGMFSSVVSKKQKKKQVSADLDVLSILHVRPKSGLAARGIHCP